MLCPEANTGSNPVKHLQCILRTFTLRGVAPGGCATIQRVLDGLEKWNPRQLRKGKCKFLHSLHRHRLASNRLESRERGWDKEDKSQGQQHPGLHWAGAPSLLLSLVTHLGCSQCAGLHTRNNTDIMKGAPKVTKMMKSIRKKSHSLFQM